MYKLSRSRIIVILAICLIGIFFAVAYAGNELKGFGNLILIKHYDGWITAYAHNEKLLVKKGQKVARGEKIATVGSTGGVSLPQLHFEIRRGKKPVNPQSYLP